MNVHAALAARAQAGSLFRSTRPFTGRPVYPALAGQESGKPFSDDLAMQAIEASAMLWRCVIPKAEKAASRPWRVWERPKSGTGSAVPISDHPWIDRIEHPATPESFAPGQGWKARQFGREAMMALAHTHRDLAGRALFGVEGARNFLTDAVVARRMDNIDPRPVRPLPGEDGSIETWVNRDTEQFEWRAEDVIDVRRTRPSDRTQGMGVVEAVALSLDTFREGQELQLRRYEADGTPGMILSSEVVGTAADADDAEDRLAARQQRRRGGVMVLPSAAGAKVELVAAGLPVEHLGLIENLGLDRDMIAIGCGYFPAGFSRDAATYNNYKIIVLHEWHLVMEANAAFADAFTRYFVPWAERGRYYLAPDYSDVEALAEVRIERLGMISELAFKGVAMNDILRAIGAPIEPSALGDKPLVPENVMPLADALTREM